MSGYIKVFSELWVTAATLLNLSDLQFPFLITEQRLPSWLSPETHGVLGMGRVWYRGHCQAESALPYLNSPRHSLPTQTPKLSVGQNMLQGESALLLVPSNGISFST